MKHNVQPTSNDDLLQISYSSKYLDNFSKKLNLLPEPAEVEGNPHTMLHHIKQPKK